jgi:putative redox protein
LDFENQNYNHKNQIMANHNVSSAWQEGLRFLANVNGHPIVMDVPERVGGTNQGSIPKPFLLAALSGCTGMDVASLLTKQRVPFTSMLVDVDGELTDTAPITYKSIEVTYQIDAPDEFAEKAVKAAQKSLEQLCGVAHIVKQVIPMTYKVIFNGTEIFADTVTPLTLTV